MDGARATVRHRGSGALVALFGLAGISLLSLVHRLSASGAAAGTPVLARLLVGIAVMLSFAVGALVLIGGPRTAARRADPTRPGASAPCRRRRPRSALACVVAATIVAVGAPIATTAPTATAAPSTGGVCSSASRTIRYDVVAMRLDIPVNGWGDHVPDGVVYALSSSDASPNAADLRAEPGRVTPLVLRAAVGDCVVVSFRNEVPGRRVGMHVDGVVKDVDSDGARVGLNADSTAATGETRTYTWFAQRAGQFAINDYGSGTSYGMSEPSTDTTSHGLYGALVVLPAGFTWSDPVTGRNLLAADGNGRFHGTGAPVFVDAHGPKPWDDFRDLALLFMDEPEGIVDRSGRQPTFPGTGLPDVAFGFNYRTEPLRNRLRAVLDHRAGRTVTLPNGTVILPEDHFCDGWTNDQDDATNTARLAKDHGLSGCLGEESHLQSWTFGDPGKLTRSHDETDVLTLEDAAAGTFTLTLEDPTLTGPLTEDGTAVDRERSRFRGEVRTTEPIPYGASAADVQAALMRLNVLPMAELADGDITVTGGPDRYEIAFGQHFAGRDMLVSVDGSALEATVPEEPAAEEPATNEPPAEEPATDEPPAEVPADELPAEQDGGSASGGTSGTPSSSTGSGSDGPSVDDSAPPATGTETETETETEHAGTETERAETETEHPGTEATDEPTEMIAEPTDSLETEDESPLQPTATVSDSKEDGGQPGRIEVLSDALLPHAYRGDPVHVRLIHPGVKETHPFHQHTNRWRQESEDPSSTRLDVQSIGPGQAMDLVYEGGAGEAITSDPANLAAGAKSMADWIKEGKPHLAALAITKASNGDQIFHCHLYPHFAQGFWGALRVFDRQRPLDQTKWPEATPRVYPDATPIEPLPMLPDFDLQALAPSGRTVSLTPMPDAAHPGYPLMVKGEYLQRAFRAPGAVVSDRYGDPALNWRRPGDTVRDYGSEVTTDLERANMVTEDVNGQKRAIPGSFFIDPCPTGVPVREYHPTAIDAKIVYNKAGWNDPNGKMYVEAPPSDPNDPSTSLETAARIRDQIQAGRVQPEPYNMRSRLGECVNMRATNATNLDDNRSVPLDVHDGQIGSDGRVSGGNAFHLPTLMSELSTHVHLVRFDELGTDGTSVGWNYVQAPMVGQTYNYRWFVDVPLRTVYFHDHQNPNTHQQHGLWAAMNVEPAKSQWTDPTNGAWLTPAYCKSLGLPAPAVRPDSTDPACYGVGSVADIKVPGSRAGRYDASFREFTVNYSDFVPMYDAAGKPLNAPGEPDDFATDQGGMAINYRNEPFPTRVNSASTGLKKEPAYVFSSAVHGDPSTPLFRAYQGDPVMFRFMGGAHEEGHNFTLAGHRWLHEPDDPNSNLFDSQFVMISEFFNFEVSGTQLIKRGGKQDAIEKTREAAELDNGSTFVLPGGAGAPGDYLYGSLPLNDLWTGMWGIFRVPAKRVSDLQPLPTNAAPPAGRRGKGEEWPGTKPGEPIRASESGQKPCPTGSPQATYNLSIVNHKIVYNSAGDHDPNGVAYVLDKDLDAAGKPKTGESLKPMFIRANEGDCLNLVFTNRLPVEGVSLGEGDPLNPFERIGGAGTSSITNKVNGQNQTVVPEWPAGNRASIHPSGLVRYYAVNNDGSAVGYNLDSTVGPGQTFTYKYYVDSRNIGVANLGDFGNLRTTRHHGAWGGLVVEPKGASYLDPKDLRPIESGEQAVIKYVDGAGVTRSYREFVVDIQDGLNLFDTSGRPIADAAPGDGAPEPEGEAETEHEPEGEAEAEAEGPAGAEAEGEVELEDMGEVGVNYRSEPFANRLAGGGDIADVFSSTVFGDPATPVFRTYANDPVMVRILNSQDLPRVHTFGISGHSWRYESNDPNSNIVTGQGGLNTGRAFNAGICAGSNSPLENTSGAMLCPQDGRPGDYLYNDRNFFHMLSGGVWGLLRVHGVDQPDLKRLPTR